MSNQSSSSNKNLSNHSVVSTKKKKIINKSLLGMINKLTSQNLKIKVMIKIAGLSRAAVYKATVKIDT